MSDRNISASTVQHVRQARQQQPHGGLRVDTGVGSVGAPAAPVTQYNSHRLIASDRVAGDMMAKAGSISNYRGVAHGPSDELSSSDDEGSSHGSVNEALDDREKHLRRLRSTNIGPGTKELGFILVGAVEFREAARHVGLSPNAVFQSDVGASSAALERQMYDFNVADEEFNRLVNAANASPSTRSGITPSNIGVSTNPAYKTKLAEYSDVRSASDEAARVLPPGSTTSARGSDPTTAPDSSVQSAGSGPSPLALTNVPEIMVGEELISYYMVRSFLLHAGVPMLLLEDIALYKTLNTQASRIHWYVPPPSPCCPLGPITHAS